MPGTAFKLWIYCLLEAAPYSDRARDLEAGELLLNYEHIRQVIGETGRQMSKSTVSNALKYLEKNNYLELQAKQFYGVKVKVVNWHEYQTCKDKKSNQTSTETVPVTDQSSTPTGTVTGTVTSTETVPDPVLVMTPEPNNGATSNAPKNIKNKELKNKDLSTATAVITEFEKEFGRLLSPIEVNHLVYLQNTHSDELIIEALKRATLRDKRSIAYIGGILNKWHLAGIITVEDAINECKSKGVNKNTRTKPGYRPDNVDWSNEPDTL